MKYGALISPRDVEEETGQRAFFEFMRLWFDPEYERRIAAGSIKPGTVVMAAQAVFADNKTIIRFNNEIRGEALIRAGRAISKGEQARWGDLAGMQVFELVPDEVDCGHVTLFRVSDDNWRCFYNFLRERSRADALAVRAGNFLQSARDARGNGWHDVAVDNLFSACELLAKANLIVHMLKGADSKTHYSVSSAINQWGKLGNVQADFVKIFNNLGNLRHAARYELSDLSRLKLPGDTFDIVSEQVSTVRELCEHRLSSEERKPVLINGVLVIPNE